MTIAANIFLLVFLLAIGFCAHKLIEIRYELKELKRQEKRNKEVYDLRIHFINYHHNLYEKLPKYDEMVEGYEPIEIKYWINKLRNESKINI